MAKIEEFPRCLIPSPIPYYIWKILIIICRGYRWIKFFFKWSIKIHIPQSKNRPVLLEIILYVMNAPNLLTLTYVDSSSLQRISIYYIWLPEFQIKQKIFHYRTELENATSRGKSNKTFVVHCETMSTKTGPNSICVSSKHETRSATINSHFCHTIYLRRTDLLSLLFSWDTLMPIETVLLKMKHIQQQWLNKLKPYFPRFSNLFIVHDSLWFVELNICLQILAGEIFNIDEWEISYLMYSKNHLRWFYKISINLRLVCYPFSSNIEIESPFILIPK